MALVIFTGTYLTAAGILLIVIALARVALEPRSAGQVTAQRQIVTSLQEAPEARRQRIIVSRSSVNWVKWACLHAQAVCTLAAIAIDPR
jgi:hypothetical protein